MLRVVFRKDSRERLSSVFASGHAGWADAGSDIVCAAVSAVLQAAWAGLTEYAHVLVEAERDAGKLALQWGPADRDNPALQAIVATAEIAVRQIARQHPQHVAVREESQV